MEWVYGWILKHITSQFILRLWMAARKRHAETRAQGSLSRRGTPAALPPLPTAPPAQRPSVSSTNLAPDCQTRGYRFLSAPIISHCNILQLLNFFGLFWLLFFIEAMEEMVMAGAFSGWYWTRDKTGEIPNGGLMASLHRTCRFHLGTLAFGSLVLSIVRMIRVLLEYVEEKLKQYELEDNYAVKCVMCCCKCCMWCLEKFIRYMNRNAYIMTAVYGYNFCKSGSKSFMLLTKNFVRAGTLDKVTDFILFIGKVIVVSIVALVTFSAFSNSETSPLEMELNYRFVPMLVIILATYAIASSFFSVYSMAVDTIFLCFLEDLDKHPGGPYYMSEDLKQILELEEPEQKEPSTLEPL